MIMNDEQVKEIARMQRLITKYENVITALYLKAKCGKELTLLKGEESDVDEYIVYLWYLVNGIQELKEELNNQVNV